MNQVLRMANAVRSVRHLLSFCPFMRWTHQPGDIIYINAAGQPVVIINSPKVAVDLLDWRAATYSDRPGDVVVCEVMAGCRPLYWTCPAW
jgi:hypothetical protein